MAGTSLPATASVPSSLAGPSCFAFDSKSCIAAATLASWAWPASGSTIAAPKRHATVDIPIAVCLRFMSFLPLKNTCMRQSGHRILSDGSQDRLRRYGFNVTRCPRTDRRADPRLATNEYLRNRAAPLTRRKSGECQCMSATASRASRPAQCRKRVRLYNAVERYRSDRFPGVP